MKMLVIGIDGGDQRIINAMDMPTLKAILNRGECLDLEEDLWSRGWAEILSGVHGRETGAFYAKPQLDGSHDFTQRFNSNTYKNNDLIVPLWTRLSELGHRVGFMNVPTINPAPQANGFIVSGAGAGANTNGASAIPFDACFPKELANDLSESGYILDIRFRASGLRDIDTFILALKEMQLKRTDAFIRLCRKYKPSFGFLAYMATTRIQYLAMSEIETLLTNPGLAKTHIQKRILELYHSLDQCIAILIKELQPKHIIVVSDHGASPRLATANMNAFLQTIGLQKSLNTSVKTARSFVKQIAQLVPREIRKSISQSVPQVRSVNKPDIDWNQTLAFGDRYVSGIYINDRERFGGSVVTQTDINHLTQRIIEEFNTTEEAAKHRLYARPYRQMYPSAKYADLLPDIWIDHPDNIFFEEKGQFVEPNKDYGSIESLHQVTRDQYTGAKGRKPLLCIDKNLHHYVEDGDPSDLTLTYKIIERAMEQ